MKKVKEIFLKEFNKVVKEMNEEDFTKLMKMILEDIKIVEVESRKK